MLVSTIKRTTGCNVAETEKSKLQSVTAGKIEKNEIGGACGVYGGGESCAQGVGGKT
jgi:hypothetical protein